MQITYFKRFRMEIDLRRGVPLATLPRGFHWVAWDESLIEAHAETKYRSFRWEIDANVFPCLGDLAGCTRLMNDISNREGFLSESTWLVVYQRHIDDAPDYCGTIQGIRDKTGLGSIQNLGVVPEFRGLGLGRSLMLKALDGFRQTGLARAFLEVTADNRGAVKLYRRMGFRKARTLYKVCETASA